MFLKTGDIIFVKSYLGLVDHVGIVVVENNLEYIYHNTPYLKNEYGGSICIHSLQSWINNRQITKIIESGISLEKIKAVTFELKEKKYNLISFNCEHYISNVVENNRKSIQLLNWLFGIGVMSVLIKAT